MTRLVAEAWRRAFWRGLVLQAALLLLMALLLDGGYSLRVYSICLIAQLVTTGLVIWRRPLEPTASGVAFVRYGILLTVVLGFGVASVLGLYSSGR